MLLFQCKLVLRHLKKFRLSSFVIFLGFSTSLACSLILLIWIYNEYNYDRFHDNHHRIYRVGVQGVFISPDYFISGNSMAPLGPYLQEEVPEVEIFVRLADRQHDVSLPGKDILLKDQNTLFADSAFFDLFNFELLRGSRYDALREPFSVLLTSQVAEVLFGDSDPIDQIINVEDNNYLVRGIISDPPANTHISYSVICSYASLYEDYRFGDSFHSWSNINSRLYVRLTEGSDADLFEEKVKAILEENFNKSAKERGYYLHPYLQSLKSIHYDSAVPGGFKEDFDKTRMGALVLAVTLLLIVAIINYVIHALAMSSMRTKEVAVKKVFGASKISLQKQFIGESFLIVFIAFIVAIVLFDLLRPLFNHVLDADIYSLAPNGLGLALTIPILIVVLSLLAGSYPAFYLSGLMPSTIFRTQHFSVKGKPGIRKALVVFQIIVTSVLITSSYIMSRQLKMVEQMDLGYALDNRIVFELGHTSMRISYESFKQGLQSIPGVKMVSGSDKVPGTRFSANPFVVGTIATDTLVVHRHIADANYKELMNIEIIEGRWFRDDYRTDFENVIINEAAVNAFGWDTPVGQIIGRIYMTGPVNRRVIGVVKDYHFKSLHEPVEPLIILLKRGSGEYITALLEEGNQTVTIDRIRSEWHYYFPGRPFHFSYLSEAFDKYYQKEQNMQQTAFCLAVFTIIIAALGLSGMCSLDTKSRLREIGIRKVFGASTTNIIHDFVKQYIILASIGFVFSVPFVYYFMGRWLENFTYRISIVSPNNYILPMIIIVLAIVLTVFPQIKSAASSHPASILKYE